MLGRRPAPEALPEVLIVEDDAVILNTLAYNLNRQGFMVHKAWDGSEALKLTRKHRPDLILLDLMLPGQYDGIAVCQNIRRDDLNAVIIMITAKTPRKTRSKASRPVPTTM